MENTKLEDAVLSGTPEECAEICKKLTKTERNGTARALGLACRFGGLYYVKALVESSASFRKNNQYEIKNYSLMLLGTNDVIYRSVFFNRADPGFENTIHSHDKKMYPTVLHILPIEHRVEIVKYLYENRESAAFDAGELLYYSIMSGAKPITETLKKLGVKFSERRIKLLTDSTYNEFFHMSGAVKDDDFIEVMQNIIAEIGDKKLRYAEYFYHMNYSEYTKQTRFYRPDIFKFIVENFDQKRMNKRQLMKGAIDENSVECLETAVAQGWLRMPHKRDEMIQYAADKGKTECVAWLLDFKNRTADLVAEQLKAEKKAERELNADPNSITELKKVWGFEKRDDGTLVITRYKGKRTRIAVPEKIGKDTVCAIGDYAFSPNGLRLTDDQRKFRRTIEKVTLPESIKSIGNGAFCDCWEMSELNIPDGVYEIGERAFCGCQKITELVIPKDVKTIGKSAFSVCQALNFIELPEGINEIGEYMFGGCSALRSVKIPDSVETIGRWAFIRCTSLEEVIIPNGVLEIGSQAFAACDSLKTVVIPASVKKIKNYKYKDQPPQNIFHESANVTAVVCKGSYAEKYCKRNNIPYTYNEEQ